VNIKRVQINNRRYYDIGGTGVFPSVTSILSATKDKSGLERWRKRIGYDMAAKISRDSADRGTVMHKLLEIYVDLLHIADKQERIIKTYELAKVDDEIKDFFFFFKKRGLVLFKNMINANGLIDNIKKNHLQEVFLWFKQGDIQYAGTVDNSSWMIDGRYIIIDYKTAMKPKIEKWIADYKLQAAAYAFAIWQRYKIKPNGAEIWIANEQGSVQQFIISEDELQKYFVKFVERVKFFNLINNKNK